MHHQHTTIPKYVHSFILCGLGNLLRKLSSLDKIALIYSLVGDQPSTVTKEFLYKTRTSALH